MDQDRRGLSVTCIIALYMLVCRSHPGNRICKEDKALFIPGVSQQEETVTTYVELRLHITMVSDTTFMSMAAKVATLTQSWNHEGIQKGQDFPTEESSGRIPMLPV
jgi:IMP cyclohydrolase